MSTKEAALRANFPWYEKLTPARQAVLISMAYQLGLDGLLAFKGTLGAIAASNFDQAADHMLDSLWAKQTPNRAKLQADMMRSGQWPSI